MLKTLRGNIFQEGFGKLLDSIPTLERDLKLLFILVERWWDTTDIVHLLIVEISSTPLDFTYITRIEVGGKLIPWDENVHQKPKFIKEMLGWVSAAGGVVRLIEICDHLCSMSHVEKTNVVTVTQFTRNFMLFMLGRELFSTTRETIHL